LLLPAGIPICDRTNEVLTQKETIDMATSPKKAIDLTPLMKSVLRQLFRASVFARENGADIWDFSEELSGFLAQGATRGELRALLHTGLIVHAEETTRPGDTRRRFKKTGIMTLPAKASGIITPAGIVIAREFPELSEGVTKLPDDNAMDAKSLFWHPKDRELWFGNVLLKRLGRPAPILEVILCSFQEQNWCTRVDDLIPRKPGRDSVACLHGAIVRLNRHHVVSMIKFCGDGTGRGIRWKWI
jgi:hypothetical protein